MHEYRKMHFVGLALFLITIVLNIVMPYITMEIIDNAITKNNMKYVFTLIFILITVSTALNILGVLTDYIYSIMGKKIIVNLRTRVIKHSFLLSGDFYNKMKTGDMINLMQGDITSMEAVLTRMFPQLLTSIITSMGFIIILFSINPVLLFIIIIFELFSLKIQKTLIKKMKAANISFIKYNSQNYSLFQELFSSIKYIVIMKGNRFFIKKYVKNEKKLIKADVSMLMFNSLGHGLNAEVNTLINAFIFAFGGYLVINGQMTLGALMIFMNYSGRLISPLDAIRQSYQDLQQTSISLNRIMSFLNQPVVVIKNIEFRQSIVYGNISLHNLNFSYKDNKNVLENINMEFLRGKVNAIVGESGSGKSTIINLIMRFWENYSGKIQIDNIETKNYNLRFLRNNIAVVSQEVILFDDTIYNNLTLYRGKRREEDVHKYVTMADANDFIEELPDKYDTMIGEKGAILSGGQKQRISLARALILNTPILIFDEITSSLDNISAGMILGNLSEIVKEKTIIIITHKIASLKHADYIYVLKNGKLIEQGTHEMLIKKKGSYNELYEKD